MRISTAMNHKARYISAMSSLYGCAAISGMTSGEIVGASLVLRKEFSHCPGWVHSFVGGYEKALRDDMYRHQLMFGGYYEGVFYSTHSNRPDYYAKHGIEPIQWAEGEGGSLVGLGHYWKTTAKPEVYFTGSF